MAASDRASEKRATKIATILNDEEQAALAEQFRAELEEEHRVRMERIERRRAQQGAEKASREQSKRQSAISALREDVRKKFYEDNGYVRVLDQGRERWLPAEEATAHLRARGHSHSRRKGILQSLPQRLRMVPLYVLLAFIAMAIALVIAR